MIKATLTFDNEDDLKDAIYGQSFRLCASAFRDRLEKIQKHGDLNDAQSELLNNIIKDFDDEFYHLSL